MPTIGRTAALKFDPDLVDKMKLDKPFLRAVRREHNLAKGAYESVIADVGANWPQNRFNRRASDP